MKFTASILGTILFGAFSVFNPAAAQVRQDQRAHSESQQTSSSRSVSVTSDGKRTIKKTVINNNGIEETITEITDEHGNTSTTRTGGNGNVTPGQEGNAQPGGPWLGVRVQEVSEALRAQLALPLTQGVLVDAIAPACPAATAGIRKGDLILTINGESISGPADLADILRRYQPGAKVEVEILRAGQRQTVEVTLTPQPADPNQPAAPPGDGVNGEAEAGGGGQIQVEVNGGDFDSILNNPNVPEEFKKTVREMQRKMEEFQRRHQVPPTD